MMSPLRPTVPAGRRVRAGLAAAAITALTTLAGAVPGALAWDSPPPKGAAAVAKVDPHDDPAEALRDNPWDTAEFDDLDSLTRHLIRTASRMSKYRLPPALPMVTRIERTTLERMACAEGAVRCNVSALYTPERGVLIAHDLKPETHLFHRSILLHELIHYLQDTANELAGASDCERWYQRELEAYALQNRFLANIYSADRVAYSGARPHCRATDTAEAQTHQARVIKAPNLVD